MCKRNVESSYVIAFWCFDGGRAPCLIDGFVGACPGSPWRAAITDQRASFVCGTRGEWSRAHGARVQWYAARRLNSSLALSQANIKEFKVYRWDPEQQQKPYLKIYPVDLNE